MLPKIIRTDIHRYEGTGVRKTEMATQYRNCLLYTSVVRHVHEHLVDGVDHDVLRRDVLEVDLIDAGAVLHVVRHPRRSDDEVNRQRRVCLQL